MAITRKPIDIDCRKSDPLSDQIMKTREYLAYVSSYTDKDVTMIELKLETLLQQQRQERNNGK